MNPPDTSAFPVSGGILAGGRSSRMGRDKAFLPFPSPDGPPLIARQAALLRSLGIRDLIVSGRDGIDYTAAVPEARVVTDVISDSGPLAGLAAILAAARHPWILVVAVDLPRMNAFYLRKLLSISDGQSGVVPRGPHGFEPLVAVYPRHALTRLKICLETRQLGLQSLLNKMTESTDFKSVDIMETELPLFLNWNSPADMAREP